MRARYCGNALVAAVMGFGVLASASDAKAFGLECWSEGRRYHHEISVKALTGAGFAQNPAYWVAWNNDTLDYYMNHPLVDVLNYMKYEWMKLHFDDLYKPTQIVAQWERALQGAFYGLLWIAQNKEITEFEKVHAAYNILGVTMHAFEDFYSHSTWVNAIERRSKTVFSFKRKDVLRMPPSLYTTSVSENNPHFNAGYHKGIAYHGGGATSQWTKFRGKCKCADDEGINLDRPCSANIAAKSRQLPDKGKITGAQLFDIATKLAVETDREIVRRLGLWLEKAGQKAFWDRVKKTTVTRNLPGFGDSIAKSGPNRINYFDKRTEFKSADWGTPFTWVGGGRYKSGAPWHFRVQIESKTGTSAAVTFDTNSHDDPSTRLDRPDDPVEAGANSSYVFGPYVKFPSEIRIKANRPSQPWRINRVRVWAYRVGIRNAQFGLVADRKDVVLFTEDARFAIDEPPKLGFKLSSFADGFGSPTKQP